MLVHRARLWGCVLLLIACGLLAASPVARAEDALRLSTGMVEPWTTPDGSGFHQALVRELFARIGLTAQVEVNLASARAFKLADDGITDGLAGRVAGMEREFTNLIAVPERMFTNDFVACGLDKTPLPGNWQEMGERSVAHILGWQVFEHNLPKVRELTTVKDSVQLLSLLKAGRTEIILHERWQAMWHAKTMGIHLVCTERPLAHTSMFIYLNKRHSARIEPLAQALRAMKADGSYDTVARKALGELGAPISGLK